MSSGKSELKIATILDKFSYECFKYEYKLIPLGISGWKETLINEKPDLLFAESAWDGNNSAWQCQIINYHSLVSKMLVQLISMCKDLKILTVFWNKEDPVHFYNFIETSKLFDYVFTTDADCLYRYKELTGHSNIFVLPFAAQARLHNPVDKGREKLGRIAFAGSWYATGHPERQKDMEIVLRPALKYGLHIYDRFYGYTRNNHFEFPDIYKPCIQGNLPYEQMIQAYKKYEVFLNVNSIQKSPTMFSRRVFELLACGTNIVSGYSTGIEQIFPGIVKLCKTEEDTVKHLDVLLGSKELRDRLSLLGQREVFSKHTYSHRMGTILDKTGLKPEQAEIPGVSIVTCTNRPKHMDKVFNNFNRQNYKKKELIIVLNNNGMDIKEWKERAGRYANVKVFQLDELKSLGECLNFGIEQSGYDFIAKFDDDDYYAPEYLGDSMNAFNYTDAGIAGKNSFYNYLESSKTLAIRFPGMENRYVKHVAGATMIFRREVFDKFRFKGKTVGEDTQFLKDCFESGIKIYSTDRFNYVCIRYTPDNQHTWDMDHDEYLRKCEIVAYTDDYITHTTL